MSLKKRRRHSKIFLVCETTILLLLAFSLLLNTWIAQSECQSTRANILENVLLMVDSLNSEMEYLKSHLYAVAQESKVSLLNLLYNQVVGTEGWLDDMNSIQWYLRALKESNTVLSRVMLMMPRHNRMITSQLLNSYLTDSDRELATRLENNAVVSKGDYLYFSWVLQHEDSGGAAVIAEIDSQRLLEQVTVRSMTQCAGISYVLTLGDDIVAYIGDAQPASKIPAREQWTRYQSGWALAMQLNSLSNTAAEPVSITMFFSSYTLHGNTYVRYWTWTVVQILFALMMIGVCLRIEKRHIRQPILDLLEQYDRLVAEDDGSEEPPFVLTQSSNSVWKDDLALINQRFAELMTKYRSSIRREYMLKIHTQQAELRYLQKQVQPHFLYNCFYNVYRMCKVEGCNDTAAFVMKIANYYSYITKDSSADGVTLDEEFQHAWDYVEIQKERFRDRFDICFCRPEAEYRSIIVPKLILQPAIENVFKYVVESESSLHTVRIHVGCRREGDVLILFTEDSGTVLGDERLQQIRQALSENRPLGTSTGLLNMKRRLEFSQKGSVDLCRSPMGGLCVNIRIRLEATVCTE